MLCVEPFEVWTCQRAENLKKKKIITKSVTIIAHASIIIHIIPSGHLNSASSSLLLLRGAPEHSTDTVNYCLEVSPLSSQATVSKGLAQGPYLANPRPSPVESHRLNLCATTSHNGTYRYKIWQETDHICRSYIYPSSRARDRRPSDVLI